MSKAKRSWREKLQDNKDLPKVIRPKGKGATRYGERMLVPAPMEVNKLMRGVRKGRVVTVGNLREKLRVAHATDSACPLTTGIFVWVCSHAAFEEEAEGRKRVTPWWRTLKAKGELNPKNPGGVEEQARRLRAEGHTVTRRGKRWFVEGVE
jgi:hypothetical protein